MTLRDEIVGLLIDDGVPVASWGALLAGRYCIVRPGGIVGRREVVDVWIVNTPEYRGDPDEGLAEMTLDIFNLLELHLVDITVTPGPVYDPSGKSPHSTMILTGSGRQRGLG